MRHRSFSTSKRTAHLALALAGAFGVAAALLFFGGHLVRPRLAYGLALGLVLLVLAWLALARRGHRDDAARIEPAFETSILAFPPEPKLGPRPQRSH